MRANLILTTILAFLLSIAYYSEEVVKKEYSFDGRNELDAIVIDAETKETIDRVTIKQETIRDTGGLFIKKET